MGWFVDYGDRVILTDGKDTWDADRVSIVQGGFGFGEEGLSKLPRPRKYDDQGKVVIEGDQVCIFFYKNRPDLPIVFPGIRRINPNDFLGYNHSDDDANVNRLRMRIRPLDANGNEVGRFDIRIGDDDDGFVDLRSTDGFVLRVGNDPDRAPRLAMQVLKDGVIIEKGGNFEAVLLGATFLTQLQAALTEVVSIGLAMTGGPSTPVPTPATSTVISNITAALAAGPPFLSTTLKTE